MFASELEITGCPGKRERYIHTHTHAHTHTYTHVHTHIHSRTHTHAHTHTHSHIHSRTHTHKQTLRQIDNNVYMYIHIDIQYLPRIGNAVGEKCALCYKEQNNLTHTSTLSPSTTYVVTAHHLAAVALSHCHIVTFSLRSVPTQSH